MKRFSVVGLFIVSGLVSSAAFAGTDSVLAPYSDGTAVLAIKGEAAKALFHSLKVPAVWETEIMDFEASVKRAESVTCYHFQKGGDYECAFYINSLEKGSFR